MKPEASARRVSAGLALLVGLTLTSAAGAHAASGFDPGAADARVGGADRYSTAALIAEQSWSSASTVIVANGETNGIDALSAGYLAGLKDAPILLTKRDSVPAATAATIAKLNPTTIVVVGGDPSVAPATYTALTAGRTGQRIAGVDRYDTAAKIVAAGRATTPKTLATGAPTSVFIARGDLYGDAVAADALAASPVSYRAHVPVLLTQPGTLPASTSAALQTLAPGSVFAIGDSRAVSPAVEAQVRAVTNLTDLGRLQGADRTETAAAIANSQTARDAGFTKTAVGIANGYRVDALAAGPAAGKAGYPLLLTESATSLGSGTRAYLQANKDTLVSAKVFGDATSVSATAVETARSSGGGTNTTTPVTPPAPIKSPPTAPPVVPSPPVDPTPGPDESGVDTGLLTDAEATRDGHVALTLAHAVPRGVLYRPQVRRADAEWAGDWANVPNYGYSGDGLTLTLPAPTQGGTFEYRVTIFGYAVPTDATVSGTLSLTVLGAGAPDAKLEQTGKTVRITAGEVPAGQHLVVTEADQHAGTQDVVSATSTGRHYVVEGTSVSFSAPQDGGQYHYSVALADAAGEYTSPAGDVSGSVIVPFEGQLPFEFALLYDGDSSLALVFGREVDTASLTSTDLTVVDAQGDPRSLTFDTTVATFVHHEHDQWMYSFVLADGFRFQTGDRVTLAAGAAAVTGSTETLPHESRTTSPLPVLPATDAGVRLADGRITVTAGSPLPPGAEQQVSEFREDSDDRSSVQVGLGLQRGPGAAERNYTSPNPSTISFDAPTAPGIYQYGVSYNDVSGFPLTSVATRTVVVPTQTGPALVSSDPVSGSPADGTTNFTFTYDRDLSSGSRAWLVDTTDPGAGSNSTWYPSVDGKSLQLSLGGAVTADHHYELHVAARAADGGLTETVLPFTGAQD